MSLQEGDNWDSRNGDTGKLSSRSLAPCLGSPPAAPRQGSLCECRIGFPHAFDKDFPSASCVPGTLGGTRVHYGVRHKVAPRGDSRKSRINYIRDFFREVGGGKSRGS